MNSSISSHELGGGGSSPLSLVRDATVHFGTGKNNKNEVWIPSSAGLSHEGCLWWGLQIVLPELPWSNPFLSLSFIEVPWKQHRGAVDAQRVQRNVRTIRGSNQRGVVGWRAGIKKATREKLQDSGDGWVTQSTPGWGCPILVFAKGQVAMLCWGAANAAMACPERALGDKAE